MTEFNTETFIVVANYPTSVGLPLSAKDSLRTISKSSFLFAAVESEMPFVLSGALDDDEAELSGMGIDAVLGPGEPVADIVDFVSENAGRE